MRVRIVAGGHDEALRLGERRTPREERRGVTVGTEAEVHEIDRGRVPDELVVRARCRVVDRAGPEHRMDGSRANRCRAARPGPCPRWNRDRSRARTARRRCTRRRPTSRARPRGSPRSTPRRSHRPTARPTSALRCITNCAKAAATSSTIWISPGMAMPEPATSDILRSVDRRTIDVYEQRAGEWLARRARPIPESLAAFVAPGAAGQSPRSTSRADPGGTPPVSERRRSRSTRRARCSTSFPAPAPDARPCALRPRGVALPPRCARRAPGRTSATCTSLRCGCRSARRPPPSDPRWAGRCTCTSHPTVSAPTSTTSFAGRHFDYWPLERLVDVVTGAGFDVLETRRRRRGVDRRRGDSSARRCPTPSAPTCGS